MSHGATAQIRLPRFWSRLGMTAIIWFTVMTFGLVGAVLMLGAMVWLDRYPRARGIATAILVPVMLVVALVVRDLSRPHPAVAVPAAASVPTSVVSHARAVQSSPPPPGFVPVDAAPKPGFQVESSQFIADHQALSRGHNLALMQDEVNRLDDGKMSAQELLAKAYTAARDSSEWENN